MNSSLSYRPVKVRDFERICQFPQNESELFFMFPKAKYPLTVAQLRETVKERFDSTVILFGDEVAGFANFYDKADNKYCCIGNVIVNADFRNRGFGRFLIEVMERIAIEKYKVTELRLSCFNTNTQGILLYSALGYFPYGIERIVTPQKECLALIELKKEIKKEKG